MWSFDRSANWWGRDTEIASDEEDSFDVDSGSADDELIAEVPWHIQVLLMKNNQKMEPSRGGGKTKWYSMVTKGNERGTFVNESKAVKKLTDKTRKREQRRLKNGECKKNEAMFNRQTIPDIRYFLIRKTTSTSPSFRSATE